MFKDMPKELQLRCMLGMANTCLTETQLDEDLDLIKDLPFIDQYTFIKAVMRQNYRLVYAACTREWLERHAAAMRDVLKKEPLT